MEENHPYHQQSMFKGAPSESFEKAKFLRRNMTEEEEILWNKLKDNPWGYKFRRQHPIHIFIVDFYCHKLKLVIEIDGGYHNLPSQKLKDKERSELLEFQDLTVVRFSNEEIQGEITTVLKKIKELIDDTLHNED